MIKGLARSAHNDYKRYNRMRNVALISDIAAAVLNTVARKRGSRLSLPMDSTSKVNSYFIKAKNNFLEKKDAYECLLKEHADYDGHILHNILPKGVYDAHNKKDSQSPHMENPIDRWGREHLQGDIWTNYLKNKNNKDYVFNRRKLL